MNIGRAIEGYRHLENLSGRQLAKKIGVDHSTLFRMEKGKEVRTDCWVKVLLWLLTDQNNNKGK